MFLLGYHLISDKELKAKITYARNEQRCLENRTVKILLRLSEYYRKLAESLSPKHRIKKHNVKAL